MADSRIHRLDLTRAQRISRVVIRGYARWLTLLRCSVEVEGLEQLPDSGSVLLAVRHVHHIYDAATLLATLPRDLHFLVALDWVHTRRERQLLERACQLAVWPTLLRTDRLPANPDPATAIWQPHEIEASTRRSVSESVNLLVAGRALVVFPEGAPVIDPERPRRASDALLPFQHGFVTIARLAARITGQPIPVVPVGLSYAGADRPTRTTMGFGAPRAWWQVRMRLGAPVLVNADASRGATARAVQDAVRTLSGL